MEANKKPAPGGNRETGDFAAFTSRKFNRFSIKLKAVALGLVPYDAPTAALLVAMVIAAWGLLS